MILPWMMHRVPALSCAVRRLLILALLCMIGLPGCSSLISSATSGMMEDLSGAVLNNDDLKLVESGAPAYLLMIDSLISRDPENKKMLSTAADLYSAYSELFVDDKERSRKMAQKALDYADRALCSSSSRACNLKNSPYEEFEAIVSGMKIRDLPALFSLGNAWAGWIMANRDDFNAIADMARIETIMVQVTRLDKTYKDGAAYLYLGTMATLLPPALGGRPEKGKRYFEEALTLSKGKNLMPKVMFAKQYAKMMFDRQLHDRLLKEVLATDPHVPGYTLINTYAQKQARKMLADAEEYF